MRLENQCSKFKLDFRFHSSNPLGECKREWNVHKHSVCKSVVEQEIGLAVVGQDSCQEVKCQFLLVFCVSRQEIVVSMCSCCYSERTLNPDMEMCTFLKIQSSPDRFFCWICCLKIVIHIDIASTFNGQFKSLY